MKWIILELIWLYHWNLLKNEINFLFQCFIIICIVISIIWRMLSKELLLISLAFRFIFFGHSLLFNFSEIFFLVLYISWLFINLIYNITSILEIPSFLTKKEDAKLHLLAASSTKDRVSNDTCISNEEHGHAIMSSFL